MREPRLKNPNPIVVTPDMKLATSMQVADYLLCDKCEQRFAANGEKWVLVNCRQDKQTFPLQSAINTSKPEWSNDGLLAFAGRRISGIDVNKIVYFGASVLWRGSAHQWRHGNKIIERLSLGNYERELQQFLLGTGDFPVNGAMCVHVSPLKSFHPAMIFPRGVKRDTCHEYKFLVPGITFQLFLGSQLEPIMRRLCTWRSPEGFIFVSAEQSERTNLTEMIGQLSERVVTAEKRQGVKRRNKQKRSRVFL